MKSRIGFVANSSSTAFVIRNLTNQTLTLVDFVRENPQLIEEFKNIYSWYKENDRYTQENLLISAEENNISFSPNAEQYCIFGDEDGTIVGHVFDYILRDGGVSKSFEWQFAQYHR